MAKTKATQTKKARAPETQISESELTQLIFVHSLTQYELIHQVGFERAKAIAAACSEISEQNPLQFCHAQLFEVETLGNKTGAWVLSFLVAFLCWTQMQLGGYDFIPDGKFFPPAVAALSAWRAAQTEQTA